MMPMHLVIQHFWERNMWPKIYLYWILILLELKFF